MDCYYVTRMVIDEATSQFGSLWTMNEEKCAVLEEYCTVLDAIIEEFEAESLEAEVDDINMTITIAMEYIELTIKDNLHEFYKLAQNALALSFERSESNNLIVKLTFPSVWDRA